MQLLALCVILTAMPNFPRIDLSNFDPSKIELPKFDLPKFELPNVDLPEVDLPSREQIANFARDAVYVGVGLAVVTAERLQALQEQLSEALKAQIAKIRAAV